MRRPRSNQGSSELQMRESARGISMLTKRTLIVAIFCSVTFFISPLLYGQANGSFLGTVSDKTGSVISGAAVTVTSQGTGLSRETKTDDTGHYLTPLLPVGNYTRSEEHTPELQSRGHLV